VDKKVAQIVKNFYFWLPAIALMLLDTSSLAGIFTITDFVYITALIFQSILFLVAAVIVTRRFGMEGGLTICFTSKVIYYHF